MKVKWGVLGAGGIARRRTIPEMVAEAQNAELVAVMDVDAAAAQSVAEQFGVKHWCTAEEELLAQNLDAVYIASPAFAHHPQALQAAAAGKHVLVEKPTGLTAAQAKEMVDACRTAGVKLMPALCMHFNPYNRKARELVQAGRLGQVVFGRAQLTCWYPPIPGAWRQDRALGGGGALMDLGPHCVDLLEWIVGAPVVQVTGFADRITHDYATEVDDSTVAALRFANGAQGVVECYFNLLDDAAQNALEVHGTGGCLIGQGTIGQSPGGRMFSILQGGQAGYDAAQAREGAAPREEYDLPAPGIYGQMVQAFGESILADTEPPIPTEVAVHTVEVMEAIYRSSAQGCAVRVP